MQLDLHYALFTKVLRLGFTLGLRALTMTFYALENLWHKDIVDEEAPY